MHGLLFTAMGELSVSEDAAGGPGKRRRSSAVMTAGAEDDEEGQCCLLSKQTFGIVKFGIGSCSSCCLPFVLHCLILFFAVGVL